MVSKELTVINDSGIHARPAALIELLIREDAGAFFFRHRRCHVVRFQLDAHPLIELSMVSGVGQPSAYGLVVLSEEARPKQHDPAFRAEAQAQLAELLKRVNGELPDYERLHMLVVAPEAWTIENGYLTPTMKIKRNRIESGVENHVEAWYASKGPVHWA